MSTTNDAALHAHALTCLEAADIALAKAPELLIDEPHRTADLTLTTVQDMLGQQIPGAALEGLDAGAGLVGMTERPTWRLVGNEVGRDAGLPTDVFVKATPSEAFLRETLAVLHMAE